jgi:hypothetical protein
MVIAISEDNVSAMGDLIHVIEPTVLNRAILQTKRVSRKMLRAMCCFGFILNIDVFNHIYSQALYYNDSDVVDLLFGNGFENVCEKKRIEMTMATISGKHDLEPPS